MKAISKIQLILCCSAGLYALAVEPSATLFENGDVKVSRALEKPHVKGSFHEHKVNRVVVYLQAGSQRFEYQDGRKPAVFDWKAGQVVWSAPEGFHSPEIVSDEPINIIEVELKKPGAGKAADIARDAVRVDSKHYKLEFENDQVRVLRMTMGAHQGTPMIEHPGNSLAIYLTDQETRATDSNGRVDTAKHKAGEVVWETPNTQKLENTGETPLEMVLVELRF
jgi:oxalate decarboxylase/phosphoglucose isomerase-like protein (cupin superfamily)